MKIIYQNDKAVLLLEELLQAMKFLIWFVVVRSTLHGYTKSVVACKKALQKSNNYHEKEFLEFFKLPRI